ncbi:MAG: hypothetical protein MRJ96_04235 [Nitrospirales bacterium]|nr:hypothetical protein [Nitrospira sp.]MDR4500649.1 hypothetical protein [Nitrospirales bacterium]
MIYERFTRDIVALLGATVVIGTGALTQQQAVADIECTTIGLLTGMMVFADITKDSGKFKLLAMKLRKPLTLLITDELGINPYPLLFAKRVY